MDLQQLDERLARMEGLLTALVNQQAVQDWYEVDQFAALVGKAPFTVREWCRLGRIHAKKRASGRGKHPAWVIAHEELLRFRRDGLLPIPRRLS